MTFTKWSITIAAGVIGPRPEPPELGCLGALWVAPGWAGAAGVVVAEAAAVPPVAVTGRVVAVAAVTALLPTPPWDAVWLE
jgi:hypothetical protein